MSDFNSVELSNLLQVQDNASTNNPLYCVYETEGVATDSNYRSRFESEYIWASSVCTQYDERDAEFDALELLSQDDEITVDGIEYQRIFQTLIPHFVTACLTKIAAEDYIKANKYNLKNPYIYVKSLNQNNEMIGVREFFLNI